MRSADVRLLVLLAAAAVLASPVGPAASRKRVGRITQNNEAGLRINGYPVQARQTPDLYSTDRLSTSSGTTIWFTLHLSGGKGAECQIQPGPATLQVAPEASVLLADTAGDASCSTSSKGGRKVFRLGKNVTMRTADPVFRANVTRRGVTVKLQRGVAVVTGKRGKSVVVAFNRRKAPQLARSVFVPASGTPQQPKLTQLTGPEQATLTQLGSKLPPVTDFKPPPTTLRQHPPSLTADRTAFFSFGGGTVQACSLGPGPFLACTSPQIYRNLPPGFHTFSVRSTDAAGNTGETKSYSWTIERSPSAPIVFESNRNNATEYQIYRIDPDGSGEKQLTMPPHQSFDPAWSPDGEKIVFESNRDTFGRSQLFVMDADGSDQHRLVTSGARDRFPKWSPDGSKIVFERGTGNQVDIVVVDADGSNPRQLTHDSGVNGDPVWSPDGSQIAFDSTRSGNAEIYVMNADGTNQHPLTNSPATDLNPAWSPDGKEIAFESDRDGTPRIYLMSAGGSEPERLTTVDQFEFHPAWSPDGSRLVFAGGQAHDTDLQIVNRDGSGLRVLTSSPNQNLVPNW